MRIGLIAVLTVLSIPAMAVAALNLDTVAGVYKNRHDIAVYSEGNARIKVEDVVEIVKIAPDKAYVRAGLYFTNGHECNLADIMRVEGYSLVLRTKTIGGENCELRLNAGGGKLVFGDKDGICRTELCGVRGMLDGYSLDLNKRRPIRYMARLLKSEEYREAIKERGR